jgi:hypothetical protein
MRGGFYERGYEAGSGSEDSGYAEWDDDDRAVLSHGGTLQDPRVYASDLGPPRGPPHHYHAPKDVRNAHVVQQVVPRLYHAAILEYSTDVLIGQVPFEQVQALSLRKDQLVVVSKAVLESFQVTATPGVELA